MTTEHCEHWHGLIAVEVVGQLEGDQHTALDAHTDQCASCREERRTLLRLSGPLAGADPDHLDTAPLPLSLEKSVLGFLRSAERRTAITTRRRRVLVGLGAAACLAVLGLALSFAGGGSGRTVDLAGNGATRASATLTAQSWGTAVKLSESDPRSTAVLTLWMRTGADTWWEAGTYRVSTGRSVEVTMACAVPTSKITEIWVRDAQGHTVLQGYVN